MAENLIGTQLGQYRLEALLGEGGMAAVYRAQHVEHGAIMAVKVMSERLAVADEFIHRFEREARLMASFDHPHILPVYDFGKQGKHIFLAMKLLEGGSLSAYARHHSLRPEEVLKFLLQIGSALDYAHTRGIVHRDLKPGNVLLDEAHNSYLADFGIAKFREESMALTATEALIGTPGYMAPEQWRSETVDARTDVYAFGVMIFELLSGRLPYQSDTPFALMYAHLDEPPPPLSRHRRDVPPTLDGVIRRAMAKVAERRYATAGALAEAVQIALQDEAPLGSMPPSQSPTVSRAFRTPVTDMEDHPTFTPTGQRQPAPDHEGQPTFTPVRLPRQDDHHPTVTPLPGKSTESPTPYVPPNRDLPTDVLTPVPSGDGTMRLTPAGTDEIEEYHYNSIDVGARTLLHRAREASTELNGIEAALAEAVINYVQEMRETARQPVAAAQGPYRSLESYDLGDHRLFFGREKAIEGLLARAPSARFTILHAESGAGKTSLIRAGIMPRLLAGGYLALYVAVRRRLPHEAIKSILLPELEFSLRDYLRMLVKVTGGNRNIFVFVDQFETFFTDVFTEAQRQAFVDELAECLDDPLLPFHLTLAMRTEYFGLLSSFQPQIDHPFANELLLRHLTQEEARRALTLPAEAQGYDYEAGLAQTILNDLADENSEIAPPQLQLVGGAMIELLTPDRHLIRAEDYVTAGGAQGVLRSYLERLLERLPVQQRQLARRIIEGLVRADQTRDVRTLSSLDAELNTLGLATAALPETVNALRENRVLRLVEVEDGTAYELVHDYLALQVQLDPETTTRKAAQELLSRRVADYIRFGSLLTDQEYDVIAAQMPQLSLDDTARHLIQTTRTARQRRRRVAAALISMAILGVIGVMGLGLFTVERESQNRQERLIAAQTSQAEIAMQRDTARITESRMLADLALQQVQVNPVTGLNLALAALTPRDRPYVPEAEFALGEALSQLREVRYMPAAGALRAALPTADEQKLLTWGDDRTVRLFDLATGAELWRLDHSTTLIGAGWVGAETQVWSAQQDGTLTVYDAVTGTVALSLSLDTGLRGAAIQGTQLVAWGAEQTYLCDLTGASDPVALRPEIQAAVWQNDGTRLATYTESYQVQIWDGVNGALRHDLTGHVNELRGLTWRGDQLISYGNDRQAIVWDTEQGEAIFTLSDHAEVVTGATWQPGGDYILTTTFAGEAILWSGQDGSEVRRYQLDEVLDGAIWQPDGARVLLYGEPEATAVLDVTGDTLIFPRQPHTDTVLGGHWHDHWLLTYGQDGVIHLWSGVTGQMKSALHGHEATVNFAGWQANGSQVVSSGVDGAARLWNVTDRLSDGTPTLLTPEGGAVYTAVWNTDESRLALGLESGEVAVWEPASDTLQKFTVHGETVRHLLWSPQGDFLVTAGDDGQVMQLDLRSGAVTPWQAHGLPVTALAWQPDDQQLLSAGEDSSIRVLDPATGAEIRRLDGHPNGTWAALYNQAGTRILSAGADGTVRLWETATGTELLLIPISDVPVVGVRWNQDETRLLAWGYDGQAHIYDAATGEPLAQFTGHTDWVVDALWTADEQQVITASTDMTIRLWEASSGRLLQTLRGHQDSVIGLRLNTNGTRLLSRSVDGTARIWHLADGTLVRLLDDHRERVRVAQWFANESRLLTTSDDGSVRLTEAWVTVDNLVDLARQRRPHLLTAEQAQIFFVSEQR